MAVEQIPIRFIQLPPFYIRGNVNQDIVTQWTLDLKAGGKIREPIKVWIPTEPDRLSKGKRVELVDGRKRFESCIAAGIKTIPAEIETFKSEAEAFARQYQTAKENSEFLSKPQRNHYIKIMRDTFKLKLSEIAAVTKISEAQVSRLAREVKPTKPRPKPKAKRFTVKGYLEEIRFLGVQFHNYRESIDRYVADKAPELATLFKALEKALPLLAQEEPQEA